MEQLRRMPLADQQNKMRTGAIKTVDKRSVGIENNKQPLVDKRNTTMGGGKQLVEIAKKLTRSASIAIPTTTVSTKESVEPKARSSDAKEVIDRSSIIDIDACDEDNPLHAAEYVRDIYRYLFYLERRQPIRADYLTESGSEVTPRMRSILADWLIQVHLRFHLLPETLHMTVLLLDRYLQTACKEVSKKELQLVGVSCMFVASKYEEMYAPEIQDFVYITDNAYTKRDILRTEIKVLSALCFDIGRPHSIHFLRRFSKAFDAEPETHTLAKFISELAMVAYGLVHVLPSEIAAASLWLAIHLESKGAWDAKMDHYTTYSEADLKPTVRCLSKTLLAMHKEQSKLNAVWKKYSSSKFMHISQLCKTHLKVIETIATTTNASTF